MKNFFNKIINKDKNNQKKIEKQKKKDLEIFKKKYEQYINDIQKILKEKKFL